MAASPFAILARSIRPLLANEKGNILAMTAFALPALFATFGLGFETANWYQVQRAMQNAADSAAIAAATNGESSYATEAKAVTKQYGFEHNVNGVTVTVSNTAPCPAGGTTCYSVTITNPIKLVLAKLVGFSGDTTYNGSLAKLITAKATSEQGTEPREYCVLALATSGAAQGIRTNGAPNADLHGCDVMSNSDAVCNGHNLKAGHGDAHGSSSGCGTEQSSGMPEVTDGYASLASNIPANTCSAYPQKPAKKKDDDLPSSNQLSGSYGWTGNQVFCGDVQLTGDVTLTGSSVAIIIRNGQLDLNGYTMRTASGAAATIIFSGDNTSGYTHAPTGSGTLDIKAPTSGAWSGVALYQDPNLTSGVDITEAGNSPTWDMTGLVYLPHSSVTFSGVINKATNGLSCFAMVVDNITVNGTATIFSQGQCDQAGLTMPSSNIPSRGKLVS